MNETLQARLEILRLAVQATLGTKKDPIKVAGEMLAWVNTNADFS
jgi:hypothetical protein